MRSSRQILESLIKYHNDTNAEKPRIRLEDRSTDDLIDLRLEIPRLAVFKETYQIIRTENREWKVEDSWDRLLNSVLMYGLTGKLDFTGL